jgi:hypothetical protein
VVTWVFFIAFPGSGTILFFLSSPCIFKSLAFNDYYILLKTEMYRKIKIHKQMAYAFMCAFLLLRLFGYL